MSTTKTRRRAPVDLAALRTECRRILHDVGTALNPTAPTPEEIDDAIHRLVERRTPTLDDDTETILDRVNAAAGQEIANDVSNHHGALMGAYEDAGYFVGLAMGLELAALTFSHVATTPTGRAARKGGA
jgi:hypothetical protein